MRKGHVAWNKGRTKEQFPQLSKIGCNKGIVPWNKGYTKDKFPSMSNSGARRGNVPWNKGLTKETDFRLAEVSDKVNLWFDENIVWNKGLTKETDCRLAEAGKKISKVKKNKPTGCIAWSRGLTKDTDDRVACISKAQKRLWQNSDYAKKVLHRRTPSYPEQIFITLCQEYQLPFRYVGNGELLIDGKNPDFVGTQDGYKLIEIWGEHWHKGEDPQNRIDFFKSRKYSCLIIKAAELRNQVQVILKVKNFGRG